MKPLIKWSGGKRNELDKLKPWYPKEWKVYIEPFAGGASAFFDLQPNKSILSDTHKELINFYKQIQQGNGAKIYKLMKQYNNTEKEYYYIRDEFKPKNAIEEAFVFFYLRKTCYRGMLRYNSQGKFNIPFGRYKTFFYEVLLDKDYINILKNTIVLNKDFNTLFSQHDNKDNFIFLDPPYDCKFKKYNGFQDFGKQEHQQLAKWFKKTQNRCLLVISETDFIKKLYKGYIKGKYKKKYAFKIHSGRVGKSIDKNHLIITNYSKEATNGNSPHN